MPSDCKVLRVGRAGGPREAYLTMAYLAARHLTAARARGAGEAIAGAGGEGAPWAESRAARGPRDTPRVTGTWGPARSALKGQAGPGQTRHCKSLSGPAPEPR